MDVDSVLASAPRRIRVEAEGAETSYELADDLIATHGGGPSSTALLVLEGGEVVVEPRGRRRPARLAKGRLGPVYRRVPGGGLAVPTGRAFVRFAVEDRAEGHRAELEASGYRLEDVPAYAPHAAWIRHRSGDIATALRTIGSVERIPGVAHVEPQFLAEATGRM